MPRRRVTELIPSRPLPNDPEQEAPEEELTHFAGHKDSRPVRIGNGAVDHLQLDIYGELMDSIYLAQSASPRPCALGPRCVCLRVKG